MICLTGDIHHMSLKTGNQQHCDITEVQVAKRYFDMLKEARVKVTFFITGKTFEEEWEDVKPLCDEPLIEIGGHTYYCFKPELWHRIWNKLIHSYNGPYWYQKWDVQKTIDMIRNKTGKTITTWRNHMYMHGRHTEKVLAECGIKICSDGVKKDNDRLIPHTDGIYNFPLNIIPDHEHLFHAERTPEAVEKWIKRYRFCDDFGPKSYYVDEWTEIVLEGLRENESKGRVSNMLIHPITLYLCDRLKSFQKILEFLSAHETIHMSDMGNSVDLKK
ncbi:MAG: polysaccharide deacetylase family protein [Candidatus Omnitrophica bacterium]|nr:polysaccharide deacetylase family protein [Candidatus Omnitrophota bacterium]